MNRYFSKVGVVGIIIALVTISFCFSALAAEKMKVAYTSKSGKMISETKISSPKDHNNEISQWVRSNIITEHTDPNFIGTESIIYVQTEYLNNGSGGKARGYTSIRGKDGDFIYIKWDHNMRFNEGGGVDTESSHQYIGGTGKYSNIKGNAVCKGLATAAGETTKCEGEWEL